MLKRELVAEICNRTGEHPNVVNAILRSVDEVVLEVVGRGEEMFLLAIGKLSVVRRKRTFARIIQTGDRVSVPAHNVVKFKVSKPLARAAKKSKLPPCTQ